MLNSDEYRDYCKRFRRVEKYLRSKSADAEKVAYNICILRSYYPERMSGILQKAGFMFIENDTVYEDLGENRDFYDLGLFKNNKFLLSGRFIFPVRDMLGNTIALIGWFPDSKKYITTPSKLFSKSCMFYGMEQLSVTGVGKSYILCEGIFDVLSLRSIGLNAIGEMGIESSRYKEAMYSLFSRILSIPDNDTQGRLVIASDSWNMPGNASYLRWTGDSSKDIDALVNKYEASDILEMILNNFRKRGKILTEKL